MIRKTVSKKGRVRYQVYVNDAARHRRVYVATFDRRKDAVDAEAEAKRRLRLGERLRPRQEITFNEMSREWLQTLVSVRPSTIADYDKAVALNPSHAEAYNNRRTALAKKSGGPAKQGRTAKTMKDAAH